VNDGEKQMKLGTGTMRLQLNMAAASVIVARTQPFSKLLKPLPDEMDWGYYDAAKMERIKTLSQDCMTSFQRRTKHIVPAWLRYRSTLEMC
jgi:hypothetical protein